MENRKANKISVIGAGNLGSFIAYEIVSRDVCKEMVLVDILKDVAEGQAMDMTQALPYKNSTKVYSGGYEDIAGSEVIVITAGKPRTPDIKDRLELATINVKIMNFILAEVKKYAPEAIIITITNPMDLINLHIHKSGWAREKVIGSGGQLDSSRFRTILGCPDKEVEAYIIGEHGAGQIPVFSKVKINGELKQFSEEEQKEIKEKLKNSSMEVIKRKGATVFAPASNTADMVESIVRDQHKLLMCSTVLKGEYGLQDVSIGVPVRLGKNGIEKVEEWELNESELSQLKASADKLKMAYEELGV